MIITELQVILQKQIRFFLIITKLLSLAAVKIQSKKYKQKTTHLRQFMSDHLQIEQPITKISKISQSNMINKSFNISEPR